MRFVAEVHPELVEFGAQPRGATEEERGVVDVVFLC